MAVDFRPCRDPQDSMPVGACARCGLELYPYDDGEICKECKEELEWRETQE